MSKNNSSIPMSRWLPALILIAVASLLMRIYFAAGFTPKDDAEFARVAWMMLQRTFDYGTYGGPPVIPARLGIILPTGFMFAVFGPNEISMAVYPLFMSLVLLLTIYYLAASTYGHVAAIIAASIWVFLPMELEISAMLWPDVPATSFAIVAVAFLHAGRTKWREDVRRQWIAGALCGLAFGLSWLCKTSVIYFVPFCAILLVYDFVTSRLELARLWLGVAIFSLAVLIVEMAFYKRINGEFLYRLTAIERNYDLYAEFFFTEGGRFGFDEGSGYLQGIIKRVVLDGPFFMLLNPEYLYLPAFGLLASGYAIYRKNTASYFFVLLLITLFIMFNFFSSSFERYMPLSLFSRYFYPLCVPAVILTGGLLSHLTRDIWKSGGLARRSESLFWGLALACFLLLIVGWSTFRAFRDDNGTWAQAERELATHLTPQDRIWTDRLSRNSFEFFWGYPDNMNIAVFGNPAAEYEAPCGSYVYRNHSYNDWLAVNKGMWLNADGFVIPDTITNPPDNWSAVWSNGNAVLFEVVCDAE